MERNKLNKLKEVLSVPTQTYKEDKMVEYILSELEGIDGIIFYTDEMNNIYVTKGKLDDGEYYPLFLAHTDTVHKIVNKIIIKEEMMGKYESFGSAIVTKDEYLTLKGELENGYPTGIGGDDKNGVFIVLELLKVLPKVKGAFFVSEETGCIGSSKCDLDFLKDVGYAVQFDAPGDNLITEICSGTRLFEEDGEFINRIKPIFEKNMGAKAKLEIHPYTDITQIKRKGDFSCINLSCGYYRMHTKEEVVVVDDVENAFATGIDIYNSLGLNKFEYEYVKPKYDYLNGFSSYGKDWYKSFNNNNGDEYDDDEHVLDNIKIIEDIGGIEIESIHTDDVVYISDKELLELYDIIKDRFMNAY